METKEHRLTWTCNCCGGSATGTSTKDMPTVRHRLESMGWRHSTIDRHTCPECVKKGFSYGD